MEIIHINSGEKLGVNIKIANTMLSRMKGLMFVKKMEGMDGLLIKPCNSVHNFFVRFALDLVFIDKDMKIVKIKRNFKPWRVSWIYLRAKMTLELPAGTLPANISEGDQLEVRGV